MPSLTVIKVDKNTQKTLAGGVFTIEKIGAPNNGTITGSPFTTDASGKIYIPELLPGSYKITEIQAPKGYNLSENNSQIITMLAGEDNAVKFENTRQPSFILTKTDGRTGAVISGAAFTVEKVDNPGKGSLSGNPLYTDENGQIIIPNLISGVYRVTEAEPANGYGLPTPNTWEINIIANQDYRLNVKNTRLPSLVLSKIDGLSYRGIPNTAFEVRYAVNGALYGDTRSLGTFVTNQAGQIVIPNCQPGWYSYTETRPAQGYAKPSNPTHTVFLSMGDNAYSGVGGDAWAEINGVTAVAAKPVTLMAAPVSVPEPATATAPSPAQSTPLASTSPQTPEPNVKPTTAEQTQPSAPPVSNDTGLTPTKPNIEKLEPSAPNGQ
jgi:uncharacterized surface anchored protein